MQLTLHTALLSPALIRKLTISLHPSASAITPRRHRNLIDIKVKTSLCETLYRQATRQTGHDAVRQEGLSGYSIRTRSVRRCGPVSPGPIPILSVGGGLRRRPVMQPLPVAVDLIHTAGAEGEKILNLDPSWDTSYG